MTIPPPWSERSPWNTNVGLSIVRPDGTSVVNDKYSVVNLRLAPGGGVRSHLMRVPLTVQVKRTVSSGHVALVLDVKVPVKIVLSS